MENSIQQRLPIVTPADNTAPGRGTSGVGASLQHSVLEHLMAGSPLPEMLVDFARQIEAEHPDVLCAIRLLKDADQGLYYSACPSLPAGYIEATDDLHRGARIGVCAAVVEQCRPMIVPDLDCHPNWDSIRDVTTRSGLRSCWSVPLCDSSQQVLGTLAFYRRQPLAPQPHELVAMQRLAGAIGVAVQFRKMQSALHRSDTKLRTLIDNIPFLVWFKDINSRIMAANTAFAAVAGLSNSQEVEGKTDFDLWPADLAAKYVADDNRVLSSRETSKGIEPLQDAAGNSSWIEVFKSPLIVQGKLAGTVGFARDVTRDLEQEEQYRSLIENSPNTFVRYDRAGVRIFVNATQAEYYGSTAEFLVGLRPSEFPGGESGAALEEAIREVFDTGQRTNHDLHWVTAVGRERILRVRLAPEYDANKNVIAVIGVGHDVTEALENQARIHRMAYFDTLTSLPNRAMFLERIAQAVAKTDVDRQQFALMVLDLDHFKRVNDTLGHAIGDDLLADAAMRLRGCVREDDLAARLGGDEFAVMITHTAGSDELVQVAQRIIDALALPFRIDGKELFVSASVGIAVFPTDSENIDELFKFADSAMYHAKAFGRNNFKFYSASMTATISERVRLESDLRRALVNEELVLFYQPKVDLGTGRLLGAEALLRWCHSEQGLITPDRFIGIAEETGMIIGIGDWVIAEACKTARLWNENRDEPVHVAINLSSRQFVDNNLVESIQRHLAMTGCKTHWLQVEITESLLLDDNEAIRTTLDSLHAMGLVISIDDFGTGFSSLSYLNRFPITQIKIDRSFVRDITTERRQASLVNAIISMARSLDKEAVAEGIETEHQAQALGRMGCHAGQGYLYGKPVPKVVFEQQYIRKKTPP